MGQPNDSIPTPDPSTVEKHAEAVYHYLNEFAKAFEKQANERLMLGHAVNMRWAAEYAEQFNSVGCHVSANTGKHGNPAPLLDLTGLVPEPAPVLPEWALRPGLPDEVRRAAMTYVDPVDVVFGDLHLIASWLEDLQAAQGGEEDDSGDDSSR